MEKARRPKQVPIQPKANVTTTINNSILPERKPNVDCCKRENERYWLHWLGFHKWTKWSKPTEQVSLVDAMTGVKILYQDRYCEVCNMYQRRKV